MTPVLLAWSEQLLWGGMPGVGPVCLCVLPQLSGWGPVNGGGAPPGKYAYAATEEGEGRGESLMGGGESACLSASVSLCHTHPQTHTYVCVDPHSP